MTHPLSRQYCVLGIGQRFIANQEAYEIQGVRDGTLFAVKFLAPDPKYIDEESFSDAASRFKREGERGSKLAHPNLVQIFAFNENVNGTAFANTTDVQNPFIIMEHMPGKTLDDHIRRLPDEQRGIFEINKTRLLISIQTASALAYLHKRAITHRDVKPANIFLSSKRALAPRAKLGDFGIMKWGDFHAAISTGILTATNQQGLGTLKYMSPEQAVRPKEVTVRSDIYSLGITLFELFTGWILASPHHVTEITMARLNRGTTASRYYGMGYKLGSGDEEIASMLLDMLLRGPESRPAIDKVVGRLEYEYERRFNETWENAVESD
jgi:serine/threonine protein kinase